MVARRLTAKPAAFFGLPRVAPVRPDANRQSVRRSRMSRFPPRIFLVSPARLDGKRAHFLFRPVTMFPAARALHSPAGATIGEIFTFLSGLYFRGKLAYAEAFARRPHGRADLPALSHGDARCGFCLAS